MIFGDYLDPLPRSQEYLTLAFSPSSVPLRKRWRNNGLSADFLADYLTSFFPGSEEDTEGDQRQAAIRSAVSFVANELLENSMKYCNYSVDFLIQIQLLFLPEKLLFLVTNSIDPESQNRLMAFIDFLQTNHPEELLIQQLEKAAMDEALSSPALGFLTMMNDYQAKLGWKFAQVPYGDARIDTVTTMVTLDI